MDVEAKRERQRQHVKRSYYRKLERMKGIRSQVEQLTQQHHEALACQQKLLLQQQAYDPNAHNADGLPHQRAVQLYVEASRLKEQLREENQQLRKLLDEKESLRVRIQNSCDDLNDLKLCVDGPPPVAPVSCIPLSLEECQVLVSSTYTVVRSFMESQSYGTTGVCVFGFRDRHQIEGDLLKFSLQKVIVGHRAMDLIEQFWHINTSPKLFPQQYPASWDITIYPLQQVDADNVVMYRLISSAGRPVALESFFLLSRLQIERGYAFIFRSVDRSRLVRNEHDTMEKQWLDMHAWIIIEESDDGEDSNFVFGGFVHTTSFAKCSAWMLEVLFIAMRWESRVTGPLFSIQSSD